MWEFIKRILTNQEGEVTLLTLEDNDPGSTETFVIKKSSLIWTILIVLVISLTTVSFFYFLTPLSTIHQQQMDTAFRSEVIEISKRVSALQDSLRARDVQLNDLKNFVRDVPDTTFTTISGATASRYPGQSSAASTIEVPAYEMISRYDIMNYVSEDNDNGFYPVSPIEGSLSQSYSDEQGHYGVDISAAEGTPFRAVEDGVIMYIEWTINFGYVTVIQHEGGIVSVYKHAAAVVKEQGDVIMKGSVIGSIGDSGVLSSGSHLHLEIWKNGIPKDPLFFIAL